jgi:tripartite-type tricarboxylate transporter receptor subunit TctC
VFAPAKTPTAILEKLHREIRQALAVPKVRDVLVASGYAPKGESPGEFQKIFQADLKRFAALVRAAKIEPE